MSDDLVIVTVAPTGGFLTRTHHLYVPVQPEEIADDVARCVDAGASVAALHARRPDGQATCSGTIYRDINSRVRALRDVVINNSTGGGTNGDLLLVREDGSRVISWDARLEGLDGGADTATLDAITAYISGPDGSEVLMDTPMSRAAELLTAMTQRSIKPEWEAFSTTHLEREVNQLLSLRMDPDPPLVNLVLGLDSTFQNALPYTPEHLHEMVRAAPAGAVIGVSINGPDQLRGLTHALSLGLHVRVGIEDHGLLHGRPAANVELVERIVAIARLLGREPASAAQAREILGLRNEVTAVSAGV